MPFPWGMWTGWIDLVFPRLSVVCGTPVGIESGATKWQPILDHRIRWHPQQAHELLWFGSRLPQAGVSNFLCPYCLVVFSFSGWTSCPKCGGYADDDPPSPDGCSWYLHQRLAFRGVVSLGPYAGPLGQVVLKMKHPSGERLAHCMARLFCRERGEKLRQLAMDCVVPIPLFPRRRLRRNINSSEVLAETIARYLGVPLETHILRRVRDTQLQRSLKPWERWKNVRGAFAVATDTRTVWSSVLATLWNNAVARKYLGGHVSNPQQDHKISRRTSKPTSSSSHPRLVGRRGLLVDDVLTAGATCHFAAEALIRAGAEAVFVAALARAQGDDDSTTPVVPQKTDRGV